MKKPLAIFLCIILFVCSLKAQKEDYVWMSGYDSHVGYDTSVHHYLGINRLNFNYTPRRISYDSTIRINFSRNVIDISDTSGNILFYSNGIEIRNKWDEIIPNSSPMNDGWLINDFDPHIRTHGYRVPQANMTLKIPNGQNDFLFFQCFGDSTQGITNFYVPKLLTTYLSMSSNSGHGNVVYRDSAIIRDTLSMCISACRHANGKDWWLLAQKVNSNCFYRLLLSSNGVKVMSDMTCPGAINSLNASMACCFSPDGKKYATISDKDGLSLYDFDRCSGTLSNFQHRAIPALVDSGWFENGVVFSPNSQFLYLSITMYLLQYDMRLSNPLLSPDTIAHFDGYKDPFGSYYCESQLAPDGKIYFAAGNCEGNYSVVDSPDAAGASCHFMPHGLMLPAFQCGQPLTPNYRLGRMVGSVCDTLTGITEVESQSLMKLFPNPAAGYLNIDYGSVDWSSHTGLTIAVSDLADKQLLIHELSRYSALHRIDCSSFSRGMYLVQIQNDMGEIIGVSKFIKQ